MRTWILIGHGSRISASAMAPVCLSVCLSLCPPFSLFVTCNASPRTSVERHADRQTDRRTDGRSTGSKNSSESTERTRVLKIKTPCRALKTLNHFLFETAQDHSVTAFWSTHAVICYSSGWTSSTTLTDKTQILVHLRDLHSLCERCKLTIHWSPVCVDGVKLNRALNDSPSQSYGMSLAVWDLTPNPDTSEHTSP